MAHPAPAEQPIYPLYNTTYTLHRLSPLSSLPPSSLPAHARALQDILTGSSLRGVRIGLDASDTALSRAGALKSVSMRPLRSPEGWAAIHTTDETTLPDDTDEDGSWGVIIEIVYEKAGYTAILLRDITHPPPSSAADGAPTHLPLLLTRLPPPLRTTLLEFLTTRFDAHASPLHLSSSFLKKALGGYIDALSASGGDVKNTLRDIVISLAFPPDPNIETDDGGRGDLKGIDVTISRDDVSEFLEHGNTAAGEAPEHAFWAALGKYTSHHLALDMSHPATEVVKIACGAFVVAKEGR
ncbi:hypothetical protein V494_07024, partial [Pseudogymnoascus sp. VKM F-4513 (FW-928)]